MQAVHEFGHVLHAWISGGSLERVVLHPLTISRTDLAENPRPLFVAWGGPIWGCLIPLLALVGARVRRWSHWYLMQFFAGFCLVANGAYIGGGSFGGIGDAGDMLRHGAAQWHLIGFGVGTFAGGLWLWNGLGPHFGIGPKRTAVDRRLAVVLAIMLLVVIAIEMVIGSC